MTNEETQLFRQIIEELNLLKQRVSLLDAQENGTGSGVTDHGALTGLADDDHTQYHNDTRGDARYFRENEHLNASAGAGSAGKPIVLDAAGHVDATMLNDADIDHGSIGGLADDDHSQYHNDTRGDARYFTEAEHLNVSAGAGDAGKPIKLDAAGHVDATMINDGDIDHTAIINIGTNTHAQVDTHIAASIAHGTSGNVVGTSDSQNLTNKTLDSTNISSLTSKTTPVDADSVVLVDSEASNFFKRVTGTNLKAYLKTYFDALYGLLASANTWTANNAFNSTAVTGSALSVTRNQATDDAPMVSFHQDNSGGDQDALFVRQDGTGDILELSDNGTVVLRVLDGGRLDIAQIIRALTSSGLQLQDDGGNVILHMPDGGTRTGFATTDVEPVTANYGAMQLGTTGYGLFASASGTGLWFADNLYYDTSWKRRTAAVGSMISLTGGKLEVLTGNTGTIDLASTLTYQMIIDSTGVEISQGVLRVEAPASSNAIASFHDADVSHPFTTGFTPTVVADEVGRIASATNTDGGLAIQAFGEATAAVVPLYIQGHLGHTSPTAPAVRIDAFKNSGGSRVAVAAAEKVLQVTNAGTVLTTVLGDGKIGYGTDAPEELIHLLSTGVANLKLESSGGATGVTIIFETVADANEWWLGPRINQANSFQLYDRTASLARFTVLEGGNVGIGSVSSAYNPGNALIVQKDQAYAGTVATMTYVEVRNDDNAGFAGYSVYSDSQRGVYQYNSASPNMFLCAIGAIPMYIGTDSVVRVTISATGVLSVKPSQTSNEAVIGGILYVNTTAVGNVGAGEDDLMTYSIPASTLNVNNQSIWYEASGTSDSGMHIKPYWGSTALIDHIISGNGEWHIRAVIFRTGAATQKCYVTVTEGGSTYAGAFNYVTSAQTLSSAVTVKVTGTGVSNNDIVQETFKVGFDEQTT